MLKWYLKITVHIIRYPRRTLDVFFGGNRIQWVSVDEYAIWNVLGTRLKTSGNQVFSLHRVSEIQNSFSLFDDCHNFEATFYYILYTSNFVSSVHYRGKLMISTLYWACILICWLQTVLCLKNGLKCSFWCSFYRFSFLTIINAHLFLINLQTMMNLVCLRIILMTSYTF